jgi:hypothetical protein
MRPPYFWFPGKTWQNQTFFPTQIIENPSKKNGFSLLAKQ